jgi:hypothetical protein
MTKSPKQAAYVERVLPSVSFYVAGLFLPFGLFLVVLPFSIEIGLIVAIGSYLVVVGVSYLLAPKITLNDNLLRVDKATIATAHLGQASVIDRKDQFLERGHKLSTLAYKRFQIGVKGLVKITLQDEKDPTPYWLVATRHPEVLVGHLNAKR